jgi:hypothetical protein
MGDMACPLCGGSGRAARDQPQPPWRETEEAAVSMVTVAPDHHLAGGPDAATMDEVLAVMGVRRGLSPIWHFPQRQGVAYAMTGLLMTVLGRPRLSHRVIPAEPEAVVGFLVVRRRGPGSGAPGAPIAGSIQISHFARSWTRPWRAETHRWRRRRRPETSRRWPLDQRAIEHVREAVGRGQGSAMPTASSRIRLVRHR